MNNLYKMFGAKIPKKATKSQPSVDKSMINTTGDGIFSKDNITISGWNLNGIRAVKRKKMFAPYFGDEMCDIVCFNETKID